MVKNSVMSAKSEMGNPPNAECGVRNVPSVECGVRNAEWKGQVRSLWLAPNVEVRAVHSALRTPHSALYSSHPRPGPAPQEPQQHSAGPDLGELLRRRARHPPGGAGELSG